MRENAIRRIAALLCIIALTMALAVPVLAAGVSAGIPVEQTFTSNLAGKEGLFTYELEAVTENAPMPEGSKNGRFSFELEGNSEKSLTIYAEGCGTYEYTLCQIVKQAKSGYTYDTSEYLVEITFYINADNQLAASVIILNSKGEKAETASFQNLYSAPKGDVPQTGDAENIALYIGIMAISLLGIFVLLWLQVKRNREEDDYEAEYME